MRFNYLPTLRALAALNHGDSSSAIELLQTAAPYELSVGSRLVSSEVSIRSTYVARPICAHR